MRAWPLAAVAVAACGDPSPDEPMLPPEPGEVIVMAADGARLCAGTEAWVPAEVARIVDATGLTPRFDLPVVLGRAAVQERCTDSTDSGVILGCAQGQDGGVEIITAPEALGHELVHGLRRQQELRTIALFEEGFAEALAGSDAYPRFDQIDPERVPEAWQPEVLATVDRLGSGETYRVAAHFVGFVQAEHGAEVMAAFMREGIDTTGDAAIERFGLHFGDSLTGGAQAWRDAGAQGFGLGQPCPGGVQPAPTGEAVLQVTIDCDDASTMGMLGADESAWVRRCLELPAGPMTVELDVGTARFEAVPRSCADDSDVLDAAPKDVEAGETPTLDFAACSWAVTFATPATQPGPQVLTMSLRPG